MIRKIAALLSISAAFAAIGDRAPSIPTTYVASHPRLGAPTTTWMNNLYTTGNTVYVNVYKAKATAWTNPGNIWDCRYTVTALLIEGIQNPGGADYLSYLTKVKGMYAASANPGCIALAYDWAYAHLDPTDKSNFLSAANTLSVQAKNAWNSAKGSPYNDSAYLGGVAYALWLGIVQYPDSGAAGLAHLNFALDLWMNHLMPVWQQEFSSKGLQTSATDPDNGGHWSEGWADYFNSSQGNGQNIWIVPQLLAWANASGRGTAFFTEDHKWLRNVAYWTPYLIRPDWLVDRINQVSFGTFVNEYRGWVRINNFPARPGNIEGLAAIYNDADIRGWARETLWNGNVPDGWEPSAFPWLEPDSSANTAVTPARSGMALVKRFPGAGTIWLRTGWGENDTMCTLRAGPGFWSHPTFDSGHWGCYKNGSLAIKAGNYRPGAMSLHQGVYAAQAIAHNTILVIDPSDFYSDEVYNVTPDPDIALPNDGGQRRTGSNYGNTGATIANILGAPSDIGNWMRAREYYEYGSFVDYIVPSHGKYAYAAANLTKAYNNAYSRGTHTTTWDPYQPNSVNRSYRVQNAVRHWVWIPRSGGSAYLVVFDWIVSANSSFVKKALIHSVNQATLDSYADGKSYVITRDENVLAVSTGCTEWAQWGSRLTADSGTCGTSSWRYQYSGRLYGWFANIPSSTTPVLTNVGGVGSEFLVDGVNYDQCAAGQCSANLFGDNAVDKINGSPGFGPVEAGQWRIEMSPTSASKEDWFFNVNLMTTTSDTNLVTDPPVVTVVNAGALNEELQGVWSDNAAGGGCTYTVKLPRRGTGLVVTATGTGCAATI